MLPYSSPEVRITEIEKAFANHQDEELVRVAGGSKASTSEKMAVAERRAFEKAFPSILWGESGEQQDHDKRQRDQWVKMDPDQKQRLIEAEFK
jgi:hypothetical protein